MATSVIVAGCRTPIGKFLGSLSGLSAPELGAVVVREAVRRAGIEPDRVDEVIMGNVLSAGLGQNPARQAALSGGLPVTTPCLSINKVCGSGLKAVMLADQAIRAGDCRVVLAGGMESMSGAPYLLRGARQGWKSGDQTVVDSMIHDGLWCAFEDWHMGAAAEHIARRFDISRTDQDGFAAESQRRVAGAVERGLYADEIVPVRVPGPKAPQVVSRDECYRPDSTVESLAWLKPAFDRQGTVTAGNASQLSDGAAAVVVCAAETAAELQPPLMARIVAGATSGVAPADLFIAPVAAIRMALDRAGLSIDDIDLFEINEAFAAQMLACTRSLKLDPARVNVQGGAIGLGHPIGASGARVLVTLLYALRRRGLRRGLASLCLGGGNAVALVVEMAAGARPRAMPPQGPIT